MSSVGILLTGLKGLKRSHKKKKKTHCDLLEKKEKHSTRKLKQHISEDKSTISRNDCNYPVAVQLNDEKLDIVSLLFCGIEGLVCHLEGGILFLTKREA